MPSVASTAALTVYAVKPVASATSFTDRPLRSIALILAASFELYLGATTIAPANSSPDTRHLCKQPVYATYPRDRAHPCPDAGQRCDGPAGPMSATLRLPDAGVGAAIRGRLIIGGLPGWCARLLPRCLIDPVGFNLGTVPDQSGFLTVLHRLLTGLSLRKAIRRKEPKMATIEELISALIPLLPEAGGADRRVRRGGDSYRADCACGALSHHAHGDRLPSSRESRISAPGDRVVRIPISGDSRAWTYFQAWNCVRGGWSLLPPDEG